MTDIKVMSINVQRGINGTPSKMSVLVTGHIDPTDIDDVSNAAYELGDFTVCGKIVSYMHISATNGFFTEVILEDNLDKYKDKFYYTSDIGGNIGNIIQIECENGQVSLSKIKRIIGTDFPTGVEGEGYWSFSGESKLEIIQRVCNDLGYYTYVIGNKIHAQKSDKFGGEKEPSQYIVEKKIGKAYVTDPPKQTVYVNENLVPWMYSNFDEIINWYNERGVHVIGGYAEKLVGMSASAAWGQIIPSDYNDTELAVSLLGFDAWKAYRKQIEASISQERFQIVSKYASMYYGKFYTLDLDSSTYEIINAAHIGTNIGFWATTTNNVTRHMGHISNHTGAWGPYRLPVVEGITTSNGNEGPLSISRIGGQQYGGQIFSKDTCLVSPSEIPITSDKTYGKYTIGIAAHSITVQIPVKCLKERYKSVAKEKFPKPSDTISIAEYTVAGIPNSKDIATAGLTSYSINYTATGGIQTTYSYQSAITTPRGEPPVLIENTKYIARLNDTKPEKESQKREGKWRPVDVTFPGQPISSPITDGEHPGGETHGDVAQLDKEGGYTKLVIPKGCELFIGEEPLSYTDPDTGALYSKWR
jgi:hypothetical protein